MKKIKINLAGDALAAVVVVLGFLLLASIGCLSRPGSGTHSTTPSPTWLVCRGSARSRSMCLFSPGSLSALSAACSVALFPSLSNARSPDLLLRGLDANDSD